MRLHRLGRLAVDSALEADEFLMRERGGPGRDETDMEEVGVGNAAAGLIVGGDRHARRRRHR
jgi:hypothetical protein